MHIWGHGEDPICIQNSCHCTGRFFRVSGNSLFIINLYYYHASFVSSNSFVSCRSISIMLDRVEGQASGQSPLFSLFSLSLSYLPPVQQFPIHSLLLLISPYHLTDEMQKVIQPFQITLYTMSDANIYTIFIYLFNQYISVTTKIDFNQC